MRKIIVNLLKNGLIIAYFFTSFAAYSQSDIIIPDDKFGGITSLMSAVADNDLEGAQFFAKNNPTTINQKNLGGATSLHIASRISNLNIAKILIEKGADVNNVDNEGWTPLMRASLSKSKEIVNLLLSNGASVAKLNSFGESAIMHAAFSDCNECLFLTLDRINHFSDKVVLRQQINEAFVIARNHDNKDAQAILENALDRVDNAVKDNKNTANEATIDLNAINSSESPVVEENMPLINGFNGKKFKFQQGDGVRKSTFSDSIIDENSTAESDEKTFSLKKDSAVKEEINTQIKKNVEIILEDADSKNVQKQTSKKFTFKKDEPSAIKDVQDELEKNNAVEENSEVNQNSVIDSPVVSENLTISLKEETKKKKGFFEWLKFWKSEDQEHDKDLIAIEKVEPKKIESSVIVPEENKSPKIKFKLSSEKNR